MAKHGRFVTTSQLFFFCRNNERFRTFEVKNLGVKDVPAWDDVCPRNPKESQGPRARAKNPIWWLIAPILWSYAAPKSTPRAVRKTGQTSEEFDRTRLRQHNIDWSTKNTVDGSEILHQLIVWGRWLTPIIHRVSTVPVVQDFATIRSTSSYCWWMFIVSNIFWLVVWKICYFSILYNWE